MRPVRITRFHVWTRSGASGVTTDGDASRSERGGGAMIVLGLGGAVGHDPAAALVVDGSVVAAADEERFNRIKHAKGLQPEQATKFCLSQAGLKPGDVQVVAYPFAPVSLFGPGRWH